ncbi:unnamed protein product [Fraxinus pennsylvanica]|uniref:AAA-type ATPase N-terminal domain-containing protein n=1 Tax=Fraxinus pennsylvanica TaxID=56036 RepID=A0AAD1ZD56_9LAMI|nr:unnamed protein product [Fraxinus pennsylvanica]
MVVEENSGMVRNQIYVAAEVYLHTKINPNTKIFRASKKSKKKNITLSMEKDEKVIDTYNRIRIKWQYVFEAKEIKEKDWDVKLYAKDCPWSSYNDDGRRG